MKKSNIQKNDYFNYVLPLAAIFSAGFLFGLQYDQSTLRIICKPAVLIIFMIYIALCADFSKMGVCFIFIGHIFSLLGSFFKKMSSLSCFNNPFLGDIFLEVDFENLFLFGLGSFLISHIWYVVGFLQSSPRIEMKSLIYNWIPSLFWSFFIMYTFYDRLGELILPVLVYSLALTFLWMSGSYLSKFRNYMNFAHQYSPLMGALLFTFSDALIALSKFRPELFDVPITKYTTIITYWVAQLFISLTAIKYNHFKLETV